MLVNRRSSILRSMAFAACCLALWACGLAAQNPDPAYNFSGQYRVFGTVVSKIDGHALGRVRVTLADTRNTQKVQVIVTAEDGRFVFPHGAGRKILAERDEAGIHSCGIRSARSVLDGDRHRAQASIPNTLC